MRASTRESTREMRALGGARASRADDEASRPVAPAAVQQFAKILELLRNRCGVDFALYRPNTIQRRINRRMVLSKLTKLEAYVQSLQANAQELDALYSDLLINVTGFFRNPDASTFLKRAVFPKLVPEPDEPLRFWVTGCSTGQEAYSLAMAYTEFADHLSRAPQLQIFATDLNDKALDKARAGLYAKTMVQDVSPIRLRRFFDEQDGGYRICKPLREAVVFARQNVLSDPSFSRMDLISCRNLLIYIEPDLQQKVIPRFHYALKPVGYLFLGASESIGTFTDLFEQVDKKHRIYSRKPGPSPAFPLQHAAQRPKRERGMAKPAAAPQVLPEINVQREADRVTLNRYAPTGVLVNSELQALQFRGDTSAYLKPPRGPASFNVLKMARDGLMLPLRAALNEAKKSNRVVRKESVRVNQSGQGPTANLEVVPLKHLKERCYLIFFEDGAAQAAGLPGAATRRAEPGEREGNDRREDAGGSSRDASAAR